ncbi:MAG: threonine--tRNA ligase [Promethearchaeota archaeon]
MKLLMIHSKGAYMEKKAPATSKPQPYDKDKLELKGKILFAFVSVEDQDTFDVDIISNQAVDEIISAINLIESFPERIDEKNQEIIKFNKKLEKQAELSKKNPKVPPPKEKPRELKKLILDPSMYKVDKILVYPWAHLSNYLSQDPEAMDVCPTIAKILNDKGYEAYFSPFGWYKSFKIECLGHEVAEMYRDIKLSVLADTVRATSVFKIITENKEIIDLCDSSEESKKNAKLPDRYSGKEWKDFQDFVKSEVMNVRVVGKEEPAHIKLMRKFELADFENASDTGNLRWYSKGVLMKDLIREYLQALVIDNGAVLVDTPVMYTVKNKKLTAQTARFPAKTYWVLSGNNRFLLRFASDFLLFNMLSEMNIKEENLPLGFYEWEQYAFRREQAGEVSGLRRLRAFTMPDLHTLCKDVPQAVEEFRRQFIMDNKCLNDLGIKSYIVIRTTEEFWDKHKDWIMDIIKEEGNPALLELWPERYYYFILKYERPVLDTVGHTATLSTIQIDVESSQDYIEQYGKKRQKYNIIYKDKKGNSGHPIILHNSPSGAVERVIWALLESNIRNKKKIVAGFKTWLSPVQVRTMAISEKESKYAEEIMIELNKHRIRADFDDRDETIGKKIRSAEVEWIPYIVIIGAKELKNKTISIRKRKIGAPLVNNKTSEQINDITLEKFLEMLDKDLEGFPRKPLPKPFRYYSKRVSFVQ